MIKKIIIIDSGEVKVVDFPNQAKIERMALAYPENGDWKANEKLIKWTIDQILKS